MAVFINDLLQQFTQGFGIIFSFWWLWLGPVTGALFISTWMNYIQNIYRNSIQWVVLEIRIPRIVEKSPKAMEQVFANLFGTRNVAGNWKEWFWDGEVTFWFSFEIVSLGGDIHFYVRTPVKHRQIVEANLYAHYPNIEIEEVPDYLERFPSTTKGLYDKHMNLWGTELVLGKNDAYPIRTYPEFEHTEEEMCIDPIASLLEVFKNLKPEENVMLQILARPCGPEWQDKAMKVVEKLKDEGKRKITSASGEVYEALSPRTPGEIEVIKTIEHNISKPGFETLIRYIYISDASSYNINFAKRGTLSAFNQFSSQDLNYFLHNYAVFTQVWWINFPYLFSKKRLEARKQRMLYNYTNRRFPEETMAGRFLTSNIFNWQFSHRYFVFNTEELATIYHIPTKVVLTAPLLRRVDSKKMGPPVGLPIFEDEESDVVKKAGRQ